MLKGTFERSIPAANKLIEYREKCRQARIHQHKLRKITSENRSPKLADPAPVFRRTAFQNVSEEKSFWIEFSNRQLVSKIKTIRSRQHKVVLPQKKVMYNRFWHEQQHSIEIENKRMYKRLLQAKSFCSAQQFRQLQNNRSYYLNRISRFERGGQSTTKTKIPIFFTQTARERLAKNFLLHVEQREIDGKPAVVKVTQNGQKLAFQLQHQQQSYTLDFSLEESGYLLEQVFNQSITNMAKSLTLFKGRLYLQVPQVPQVKPPHAPYL